MVRYALASIAVQPLIDMSPVLWIIFTNNPAIVASSVTDELYIRIKKPRKAGF